MFYEEPETAKMVAFRFLKNGLERGDHCTYDIPIDEEEGGGGFVNKSNKEKEAHGITSVLEQEMQENGIDVSNYKDKGLLYLGSHPEFEKVTDFGTLKESVNDLYSTLLKQFGSESKFPTWRWIGRSHVNIKTNDGMLTQLALEKHFQHFENDPLARRMYNHITAICTYKVDSIIEALDRQEQWMVELLQNHDAVIFLPKGGNGLVLKLI